MPDPAKTHHSDTIKRAAELGVSGPAKPMGVADVKPDPTEGLTFEPTGRRMLVRRADSDESLSKGGIVMPANADRPTHVSEIITLGDGLEVPSALARVMRTKVDPANRPQLSLQDLGDAAQFLAMPQFSAAVGDLVLHSRNAGYAITIDGEQLKLLSDGEILGIWRRPGVEGRTTAPPMR